MSREQISQIITRLSAHSDLAYLSSIAADLGRSAWANRDFVFPRKGSPTLAAANLPRSTNAADDGPMAVLKGGVGSAEDLDTLTALILLHLSANWSKFVESAKESTQQLLWLETYSALHCLASCASVLDSPRQRLIAENIAALISGDRASTRGLSTPELQIGLAWLRSNSSPDCAELAKGLVAASVETTQSPMPDANESPIEGRLGPQPRHPAAVALCAVTGWLFVERLIGWLGQVVLLRRTPTSVWLSVRGLELFSRHELLGRVVKERRIVVPLEDIRTVEREVRFPRFGLYAGLLALACGTLLGTRLFVDGLRVAGLSSSLILMGLTSIGVGIVLDMLLSGLGDSLRSRCRLVVSTRRGRSWAVGDLEPSGVDRLLTALSTRIAASRQP